MSNDTPKSNPNGQSGSAESDLWHEYLRSEKHQGYDGLCKCYCCKAVRDGYEKWKYEHARRMQPNADLRQGE